MGKRSTTSSASSAGSVPPPDVSVESVKGDSQGDSNGPANTALLHRAFSSLDAAGEPLPTDALARLVFGAGTQFGSSSAPWDRMLTQMLGDSPLFTRHGDHSWGLARWNERRHRLGDMEWAVLDIETTGLAPGRHRIIEVGVVLLSAGNLGEVFQRLINPERRIPQFITSFTGIRQSMVNRARLPQVVLPELHAFLDGRTLVGHNIAFDLGFLDYEAERLGLAARFNQSRVDTIELARHFLTGMRRARLDRVATALHVPVRERHRALADARITAQVFALLLTRAIEAGCETLDDLQRLLAHKTPLWEGAPAPRPTGSMYLNPAWRREFPAQPGVYLMKDERGDVIYVGKAKCLRDRLASYYNQPLGYVRKLDGLIQSVHAIETRVLGSELEALLEESRLIKALQPRFNVQLRNYEHYPFIKVDVQHDYPRIYATREVAADGARYFGPFRSGRIVDATIELLHRVFAIRSCTRALPPLAPATEPCLRYHLKRCPAPCRGALSEIASERYRAAVEEACAFLGGERDDLLDRMRREMFAAAASQDFERAARLRDALRGAEQVLLGQRLISGAVDANNMLIVYPSTKPEHVEMFLVRHGRLIEQKPVATQATVLLVELLALADRAAGVVKPPDRVRREEVDEINILARWIHRHAEEDAHHFFPLPRALTEAQARAEFVERAAAVILSGGILPESDTTEETESPESEA